MTILEGSSGYFSPPADILDPFLFEGTTLRENVRIHLLDTFYKFMSEYYKNPRRWCTLWLAGSGISYQWKADRGNGDLDVLFGIDYDKFLEDNSDYEWLERHEIAEAIDNNLKLRLWSQTAETVFKLNDVAKYYEVTYFLNDNVTAGNSSIVNIHPYAAYNLNTNEWTTKPSKNTAHINELFEQHVQANNQEAARLLRSYNTFHSQLSSGNENSPRYINALRQKDFVVAQMRQLFDSIHLGRKQAFSDQGEGYSDVANYLWQSAKRDGIIGAMRTILAGEK